MFNVNNSSLLPSGTGETSEGDFTRRIPCILWHLQNKSSYDQAQEACSAYTDFMELGTGMAVVFWLVGLCIIISNAAVLWGIIRAPELRKQLSFLMANLAVADMLAGIGLLLRCQAVPVGLTGLYFTMNIATFLLYSQMMSASALCLMSISSYVAIRHPIFFHTHAHRAKRDAGVAIVSSWLVLTLFGFAPSMGWNCLDMPNLKCFNLNPIVFGYLVATIMLLLAGVMLVTNISVFIAIKARQKRRLGQPGGPNNPGQNSAKQDQPNDAAERKYQRSVHKARTVMIQVVAAITFWLLPMIVIPVCRLAGEKCPLPRAETGVAFMVVLNSAVNPVATIIRTPDLRKTIRQDVTAIHEALVTMMRGNRVNPQDEETPQNQRGGTGAASGSERTMPTGQPATGPKVTRSNQVMADCLDQEIVELD
ncbi:PREDICTED: LOW QUALITY PROTEIN: lysophosphatidic acid receptor 3-like [Branchiostoma belcheri]|uniref:LOW QUALITY PROTEIN: lysophosphatidic acid receptor 3-like n=1 Tax=Branchiostoma belcheri TaxID=7741 RepID=A0A6P4ZH42_BRABE|nr:PREDICTED: LOW QUALITY PROTEIN: lysophosphatidic acid receptor 3-like [Branchiostoma belcheri]